MMPNAAQSHGKNKQREKRYWDDQFPNWLSRIDYTGHTNDPPKHYAYDIAQVAIHQQVVRMKCPRGYREFHSTSGFI